MLETQVINQVQQNNSQSQHNIVYNQQQIQQPQLVYTTVSFYLYSEVSKFQIN